MTIQPALTLKDIKIRYGEGTPFAMTALENVNISFPKGKVTGIIGHTGSGKSTLAMLLNGLLKPTEGQVLLNGEEDIWRDKKFLNSVRFKVGLVFQYPEYQLFEETVAKDIAFGPKNMGLSEEEIKNRVKTAAEFCGLDGDILEASPFEISGGQKRRAAIAGVVAMNPEILVLDEPAAGLDPKGREEIIGGLLEYRRQTESSMILISHSMEDIAKYSDYILVLKKGGVYMFGTVNEIFTEAEKLFGASLDLPQITKLFIELKKRGIVTETDVYTVKYAKNMLAEIIGKKGVPD